MFCLGSYFHGNLKPPPHEDIAGADGVREKGLHRFFAPLTSHTVHISRDTSEVSHSSKNVGLSRFINFTGDVHDQMSGYFQPWMTPMFSVRKVCHVKRYLDVPLETSKWLGSIGYNLVRINGVYWGYNGITHLVTFFPTFLGHPSRAKLRKTKMERKVIEVDGFDDFFF